VKRPKGASLLQMGAAITQRLRKAHSEHMFSRVAVEQFVKGFSGKHYQTRVLFQLAQVNGIVSYECMNITGCEPIECVCVGGRGGVDTAHRSQGYCLCRYMASQVRTRFGLRRPPRSEGSDGTSRNSKGTASNARTSIKHVVHTWVEAAFPDLQLPQTRNSTPRSDAFDMCDAVVVAAFHVCTLAAWSMLLDVAYPCGAPPAVRAVLLPDTYAPPVRLAAPDHALRQYIDAFACTRRVRASLDRDVLAETAQQCLRSIIRAKLQERGVEAPQMETVEDDAILDMPDANIAFRVAKMFVADVHEVMAHRIPGGAL